MSKIILSPGIIIVLCISFFICFCFKGLLLKLTKFLVRGTFFSFIMFLVNFITLSFGTHSGLNPVTYIICGVLGGYGLLINYIFSMMF